MITSLEDFIHKDLLRQIKQVDKFIQDGEKPYLAVDWNEKIGPTHLSCDAHLATDVQELFQFF